MSREVRYFGPHREPAVLVEDFGELRTGMVVWVSPCGWCGSSERSLLLTRCDGLVLTPHGGFVRERSWRWEGSHCGPGIGGVVGELVVRERRLFAVIDEPPAKAESRTQGRKLENA